jgi:phosphate/sulfate permease
LLLVLKAIVRSPKLYQAPEFKQAPPLWIRSILVLTCTGVSFAHGSNDGQKGMGLIMLILIGIIPATYALNLDASEKSVAELELAARSDLYLVSGSLNKLNKQGKFNSSEERAAAVGFLSKLRPSTEFIPVWVRIAVAFALGCGTMIGWKRIVITVGEKIGKSHLTYAQGASAELVAMGTILAADNLGLPVSTTHVLSSGIAGTMAANRSFLGAEAHKSRTSTTTRTIP